MTTPPPIHPLAKEAAEKVFTDANSEHLAAQLIQTTALDPVLKAGEEMRAALDAVKADRPSVHTDEVWLRIHTSLDAWRALTSPETGQEGSDGLNSEPAKPPSLPSDEPEAPGTPGDRPRQ